MKIYKVQSDSSNKIHYYASNPTGRALCGVKINSWSWSKDHIVTCKKCIELKDKLMDATINE